ncbi:MAG: response regulator transcription factor [Chloroflexota bacterium]|nr:response regulator transcription factor [Anaerolineales bacterium]MCA9976744.1 response regulator transcription factor [Anaerolineales bacterium]
MQNAVILLVEGEGAGTNSPTSALKKAGYNFEVVHTGTAAFAWIESHGHPNLVIFDSSTMRSKGSRTCRRLRRMLGDTPIIHSRAAATVEDPSIGADVYLEHPYTPRKLLNRVRALLPADITKEEIIYFGSIILYRSKSSVELLGRGEQRMTPKLLQLLEEFLRHPEEIISRRQLMQNVWKTDYIGDTRTLDVHIRWVRECIEEDPAKPKLLQTVRGKGYIFRLSALHPEP